MKLRWTVSVLAVVAILLIAGTRPQIQQITDADKAAIRTVFDQWAEHRRSNRAEDSLDLLTEDVVEITSAAREGQTAIAERWAQWEPSEWDQTMKELYGLGDLAYAWIEFSAVSSYQGREPRNHLGNLLCILRKQANGSWLISRFSFNSAEVSPD